MGKLFLGINNHVVCLNKVNGEELWKTKLKRSTITNVCYEDNKVFAYSGGHFFCLNASDGSVVWENPLKGLGYSTCIIASESQSTSIVTSQVAAQQVALASASAVAVVGSSGS